MLPWWVWLIIAVCGAGAASYCIAAIITIRISRKVWRQINRDDWFDDDGPWSI